jgi:hypothetical protein
MILMIQNEFKWFIVIQNEFKWFIVIQNEFWRIYVAKLILPFNK